MLTKEELQHTYIEYDSSITEEIFNKILKIAKDFQEEICPEFEPYNWFESNFKDFCNKGFFWFGPIGKFSYGVDNHKGVNSIKQIYPKDILGEEIQQYLPVGHPDLIVKKLTVDDLVEGEFYYCTTNNREKEWVYIYKKDKYLTDHNGCIVMYKSYYPNGFRYIIEDSKVDIIKPADALQKKWLKTCIKQDKFIEQSELDKYDIEGNLIEVKSEFKIGDYVTIIGNISQSCNKIGETGIITEIGNTDCRVEVNSNKKYGNFSEYIDLRPATPEEIIKATKSTFEFNKWYKSNNVDGLFFIQSENTGYGFRSNHVNYWFTNNGDFEWNRDGLELATNSEVKKRLLSYAKEKYPVGTKFKELNSPYSLEEFNEAEFDYYPEQDQLTCGKSIYIRGKWAKIISKSTTETKEFDRDWYVEVNSQEEADAVLNWLESQGEKVCRDGSKRDFSTMNKYIRYYDGFLGEWDISIAFDCDDKQKQLSDILPNYSKVNRNNENYIKYPIVPEESFKSEDSFQIPTRIKSEEKTISRTIPTIEKATNRLKTSPINKRSLPEIY